MVNRGFVASQLSRLAGLRYAPSEPAALREILTILERAESEDHAKRTVDALLAALDDFPTPREVSMLLDDCKSPTDALQPPDPDCGECHGVGWIPETRGGYEGVRSCQCREVCRAKS
jgi:hypothetical protein